MRPLSSGGPRCTCTALAFVRASLQCPVWAWGGPAQLLMLRNLREKCLLVVSLSVLDFERALLFLLLLLFDLSCCYIPTACL